MSKPTLFYSTRCEFSKEIYSTLEKNSIIEQYELVNIDNMTKVPLFVDRVPLLFHNNKVLHDEGLFNYIESIVIKSVDVEAFTLDANLTDAFSFIGDGEDTQKQYLQISTSGQFVDQKIDTPADANEPKKLQSMEELMFKRENEVKNI
jgi:hypothetical protein